MTLAVGLAPGGLEEVCVFADRRRRHLRHRAVFRLVRLGHAA